MPVSAETLNGTLGGNSWSSSNYENPEQSSAEHMGNTILFHNFEHAGDFISLIRWDPSSHGTTDAGAPVGAQTNVIFRLSNSTGQSVGSGYAGYQKIFNNDNPPVEQPYGYFYVVANTWNDTLMGDYPGSQAIYIEYDHANLYNYTLRGAGPEPVSEQATFGWMLPDGTLELSTSGLYTINFEDSVYGYYSVTKPSGLGISGFVNKTNGADGTLIYPSRVFISDSQQKTISSDSITNNNRFIINTNATQIYISILSPKNQWYNSSLLFTAVPTVTPTPAPTIPVGYVRTNVAVWDRSGNLINGANIDIYDIENTSWTNTTHSTGGRGHIDTLPNHHIDIYGSYDIFANEFAPNQLLNQEVGSVTGEGYTYTLTLFPIESIAPVGYTSLYVEVKDATSHNYLNYVVVKATLPNGTVYSQNTADAGSAIFIVPNNTVINCAASLTGYLPGSVVVNSGPGEVYTATIELSRQLTATPTPWVKPTLTTQPVITRNQTTGNYTGFWSPFYNGLTGMGASNGELGLLMTMFLVIFGLIGGAIVSHGNGRVASACGSAGFIFACGFQWIPLWLILAGIAWMLGSFFLFRE
jgi:hypothetical protein